ncbi:hypothetical protein SBOR_9946 [Sclerotinia borealis F-4128]|uniref:BTB domain-containing protein n=1 Tax=Sclerotinia borealis (strain F-4128) TaxID=1432307 RepID=W9C1R1_SCLBF|nr:hypothetical protein SBOR_9946 [Sclerotinia borealis F-4128]
MALTEGNIDSKNNSVQRYSEVLGTDIVKTVVGGSGTNKVKFAIRRKILCARVPFFKCMFMGDFAEATTQSAALPEDDPDAFRLLLTWLYTGSIASENFPDDSFLIPLSTLFILAEKYNVSALMDSSIDRIILAYAIGNPDNTTIDMDGWSSEQIQNIMYDSIDFARDVSQLLRGRLGQSVQSPFMEPDCDYHQHKKDEPCLYGGKSTAA